MVIRYSLLAIYFGFSAYYSLESPDLSPERYLLYSMSMGVILGFALPYRSFAKSFVYTNVGTISAIFGCMNYCKGSGITISNVKKCVALGVLISNLLFNYFFDNKAYLLIIIGALLNFLYAFELVNIIFDRINDYDLDSAMRNSSPEQLSVCAPAKGTIDFWKKILATPSRGIEIGTGKDDSMTIGLN